MNICQSMCMISGHALIQHERDYDLSIKEVNFETTKTSSLDRLNFSS